MLGKLLKYDLKNVFKVLSIFYSITFLFAILTRIFLSFDNSLVLNVIGKICSGTTISMFFNIIINNIIRVWVRFAQNFYKDEAYLTHTLPVKRSLIYISKVFASIIAMFTSVTVITVSLFIAYYSKENFEILKNLVSQVANLLDSSVYAFIIAVLFVLFLEFVNALGCGFTGIIIGHKMNSAKTGFSVLFGCITYFISQGIVLLLCFIIALFNKDLLSIFTTNTINIDIIKPFILITSILYIVIIIANMFINILLLKKGVDID